MQHFDRIVDLVVGEGSIKNGIGIRRVSAGSGKTYSFWRLLYSSKISMTVRDRLFGVERKYLRRRHRAERCRELDDSLK